jgi:hypothetical protein
MNTLLNVENVTLQGCGEHVTARVTLALLHCLDERWYRRHICTYG